LHLVVVPKLGIDQCLVCDTIGVMPPGGVKAEVSAHSGFGLGILVLLPRHDGLPEVGDKSGVVGVSALADDGGDRLWIAKRKPPADRRTVILDVERVFGDPEL